jgi:hypothetical protein
VAITPISVACGTFRVGLRTTPAAAAAHSTPRKAQKAVSAEDPTAVVRPRPCGFQDAEKIAGWKANQPKVAATSTGRRPIASVRPSTRATARAPIQETPTASQMAASVTSSRGVEPASAGTRYPAAPATATAIAAVPTQLVAQ